MRRTTAGDPTRQLGFDTMLAQAASANHRRTLEQRFGPLPRTMADALPFFRGLLAAHHAAMLAGDSRETLHLREKAVHLATQLNGGRLGILADERSPGSMLRRETAAAADAVPLWGQQGSFVVTVCDVSVRIEMDGLFGICAAVHFWLGFAAHAVDWDRPFISETGYRSFLNIHAAPAPGLTPDTFAAEVVAAFVARERKGKLVGIEQRYRPFEETGSAAP